jgi:hypothetical protein
MLIVLNYPPHEELIVYVTTKFVFRIYLHSLLNRQYSVVVPHFQTFFGGDDLRLVPQNAIVLAGFLPGKCRNWQTSMT